MQVSGYSVDHIAASHKALSDPTRIRILAILLELGELCGCDVETALDVSQSKASRHLGILKQAGFVEDRRDGTWVYYRVAPHPEPLAAALLRTLKNPLRSDPAVAEDIARAQSTRRSPCSPAPTRRGGKR